ncbi:hypothetical protein NMY22_g18422 [Coprinellus aureogranulatus]|nr:hypothetical protein NMY22_g18422 [Coprinellus aureogranulatus]
MTGEPTDEFGQPLPPRSSPPPRFEPSDSNDFHLFDSQMQYRLANFLYREDEMSGAKINEFMEIWAPDKAKNDDLAPYNSYADMYATIDAIEHGDAPWRSFSLQFDASDSNPADESWKQASYEVWYRDPLTVVTNLLDNPDFDASSTMLHLLSSTRRVSSGGTSSCPGTSLGVTLCSAFIHQCTAADRKYDDNATFCRFKKQLYHASISQILHSLKAGMTTPEILRCPDGHFRRVIFKLASFIADYPEQVVLAGIIQNWCPRCTGMNKDLDGPSGPRERDFTEELIKIVDGGVLWDLYGIDNDVLPFTHDFPRADIHEILTPDLLHQVIKGMFKDHLVSWVGRYLVLEHGAKEADEILDDIDRRIAAAPSFPGLRRFPHGPRCTFPLSRVHVPNEMIQAISSFLDFCYLARRADITEDTLKSLDKALQQFYLHRRGLPHFGPAARAAFVAKGLLNPSHMIPLPVSEAVKRGRVLEEDNEGDWEAIDEGVEFVEGNVKLARRHVRGKMYPWTFEELSYHIGEPRLLEMTRRFLHDQQQSLNQRSPAPSPNITADHLKHAAAAVDLDDCPHISVRPFVFHSAVAMFYAPSDESGIRGMKRERLRSTPLWRNQGERHDCALVVVNRSLPGMKGLAVARIALLFSFKHGAHTVPCALVDWFKTYGGHPDPVTGLWRVIPEFRQHQHVCSVIHLDSLLRGVHLLPAFNVDSSPLPYNFHNIYDTLSSFASYYVNKYADHHSHEIVS